MGADIEGGQAHSIYRNARPFGSIRRDKPAIHTNARAGWTGLQAFNRTDFLYDACEHSAFMLAR
jgi:hypothetical protein